MDPSAYTIFSQVLSSHQELVDTVLAAINQVQALFRLPSLGQSLQLTIATLEIQLRAPLALQNFGGQQYKFLESFCHFQDSINNPDDNQPDHWDLAVYLTGLDLFSDQGAFNTLGLAHTGGMCSSRFACLLTEFGTMKKKYRGSSQYPSTGLGASFVLAHEIGHSLGLRHDDHQGLCQKVKKISSTSEIYILRMNNRSAFSSCLLLPKAVSIVCTNKSMNLLDCYALAKLHTLAVTSKCHKYFRLFPAELSGSLFGRIDDSSRHV